jgi:RHS repeat-associated protein
VTDTYDYDAWGNAVNATGPTPNAYLYRGEQYDRDLGCYYLRSRYLNPLTGRFLTRDSYAGSITNPAALHKYLYAYGDPVDQSDPSGMDPATDVEKFATSIVEIRSPKKQGKTPGRVFSEYVLVTLAVSSPFAALLSQSLPDPAALRSAERINCIWREAGSWLVIGALAAAGNIPAAVEHVPGECQEEPQKACKNSIYSDYELCSDSGRPFSDKESAARSICPEGKPTRERHMKDGCFHYDVKNCGGYESIVCCPCCDDTKGTAELTRRCRVSYE